MSFWRRKTRKIVTVPLEPQCFAKGDIIRLYRTDGTVSGTATVQRVNSTYMLIGSVSWWKRGLYWVNCGSDDVRKHMRRIQSLFVLALLAIAACQPSTTLSRGKAKALIEASSKCNPVRILLTQEEINAAQDAKYLTLLTVSSGYNMLTRGPLFTRTYVKVSPDGERYFMCPCKTPRQFEESATWGRCKIFTAALVKPHVVEVTGITEVPDAMGGGKLVEYTWSYDFDGMPGEIRGLFKSRQPQASNARLRLYDDGWRLQEISQ
jgi:hypothetical protein